MVILEVRSEIKFEHSDNRLYFQFFNFYFPFSIDFAVSNSQSVWQFSFPPASSRSVAGCPRRRGSERPRSGLERGEGFPLLIIQTTVLSSNQQETPLMVIAQVLPSS